MTTKKYVSDAELRYMLAKAEVLSYRNPVIALMRGREGALADADELWRAARTVADERYAAQRAQPAA